MSKITRKKKIKEVIIAISFRDFFFSCVDYEGFTYRTDKQKVALISKSFINTLALMENSQDFVADFITNQTMRHRHGLKDAVKNRLKKIYVKGLKTFGFQDELIERLLKQILGQGEIYQCELSNTKQYRLFYSFERKPDENLILIRPLLLDLNHMVDPAKKKQFDHVQNFCLACLKSNCK